MNLDSIIQNEIEREKQTFYINAYVWNLESWYWRTHLQSYNGDTDIENRFMDTVGTGEGRMNQESTTETHTFSSVQSLSCVQLFVTPWIAAWQPSLSITNSQSLLKLMSIDSVMSSSHLILCGSLLLRLQSFPASGASPVSRLFSSGGQSIRASASAQSFQWIFRINLL